MHSLIFHVDVNSAFLSWESAKRLRDNPDALDLRTINAVIGGDEKMRHGVVTCKISFCEEIRHYDWRTFIPCQTKMPGSCHCSAGS